MNWTAEEDQEFIEVPVAEDHDDDQEDYRKISANKTPGTPSRVRRNIAKIEDEVKVNIEANSDIPLNSEGLITLGEQEQRKGNTMGGPFADPGFGNSAAENRQLEGESQRSLKFSERSEMVSKKADSGSSKQSTVGQTREVFKL